VRPSAARLLGCVPPARRRPRPRRSGYRPRQLSPQLAQAITAEAHQVEELEAPLAVIAAVTDVFGCLDDAPAELGLPRLKAIAELRRQGWSFDPIAAETNLSKGRVAQLARGARARRLGAAAPAQRLFEGAKAAPDDGGQSEPGRSQTVV
jgi:hypothetical protein